jgi:hypothetical protein
VLITYLAVSVEGEPVAVIVVGGLAVLAALWYLYVRRTRSRALAGAGLFDHTTSSDLLGGS